MSPEELRNFKMIYFGLEDVMKTLTEKIESHPISEEFNKLNKLEKDQFIICKIINDIALEIVEIYYTEPPKGGPDLEKINPKDVITDIAYILNMVGWIGSQGLRNWSMLISVLEMMMDNIEFKANSISRLHEFNKKIQNKDFPKN